MNEPVQEYSEEHLLLMDQLGIAPARWQHLTGILSKAIDDMISTQDGNLVVELHKEPVIRKIIEVCDNKTEAAAIALGIGEYFGQKSANPFRSLLQQAGVI